MPIQIPSQSRKMQAYINENFFFLVLVKKTGPPVAILPSIGWYLFHSFQSLIVFKQFLMETKWCWEIVWEMAIVEVLLGKVEIPLFFFFQIDLLHFWHLYIFDILLFFFFCRKSFAT